MPTRLAWHTSETSRRAVLGLLGGSAVLAATGCGSSSARRATRAVPIASGGPQVLARERDRARSGTGRTVAATLTAAPGMADLGGRTVATWLFNGQLPGPTVRATAGDTLDVTFRNRLPEASSVHWHGIALRNDMDGVPGLTQQMTPSGGEHHYRFIVPDPGTYWAHSHSGMQLDRGLMLPLVVDAKNDPGAYDVDHTVLLDDWLDGLGSTPDAVLAALEDGRMVPMPGMDSMTMVSAADRAKAKKLAQPSYDAKSPLQPQLGDVRHPFFLANGRLPAAPVTLAAKAGQRVRLRLINGSADTAFRVRLAGHRMTVIASDGWPLTPVTVDEILIAMGERYDMLVTVGDGLYALEAGAEGKGGAARALVGTPGRSLLPAPPAGRGKLLEYGDLSPVASARLPARTPDRDLKVTLSMDDARYRWTMNGRTWADHIPLEVRQGERLRLTFVNDSEMFHPMHLHGHTYALVDAGRGTRKDTTVVRPGDSLRIDVDADNPGAWALHCHNLYHGQAGMMTELRYVA